MSRLLVAIDAHLAAAQSTGDSSYWTGLLYGFARTLPEARFLLYSNVDPPSDIPTCDKFEWVKLPSSNLRWWNLVSMPLAARRARADVLHTQYNLSPLAGHSAVTTIHDVSFFVGPEWFRARDLAILRRFIPSSARRAKRVITVSETSKSEIERFISAARGKVSVTPLACPVHIDPNAPVDVRSRFSISDPFLLTVGTRWPRKNMQLAIDAASKADQTLVITGKAGWGEEDTRGKVIATGYVDAETLSSLYRDASLYLAPSRHEGFGLPLLEAFACGCPVMCSEGGALPETAGDAAIVNRSWRSSDWADSIRSLIADSSKLNDLRRRGLERVAQFSWEQTARLTMQVYEQVAMEKYP